MNRYQAKLKIFELVKENPNCAVRELYWLWLGGVVRDGECVGILQGTTPERAQIARNIDARLSDLVREGALVRSNHRYRADLREYKPKLSPMARQGKTKRTDKKNKPVPPPPNFMQACGMGEW